MKRSPTPSNPCRPQRGISLIVVLLLLAIVSILGAGAAQISLLGERSARNDRDSQVAWQSAEAALIDAEFDIRQSPSASQTRSTVFGSNSSGTVNVSNFPASCGTSGQMQGLCAMQLDASNRPAWLSADFTNTSTSAPSAYFGQFTGRVFSAAVNGTTAGTPKGIQPVQPPRYIVELVPDTGASRNLSVPAQQFAFRVTAMGFGPRTDIQAVLQMIYRN